MFARLAVSALCALDLLGLATALRAYPPPHPHLQRFGGPKGEAKSPYGRHLPPSRRRNLRQRQTDEYLDDDDDYDYDEGLVTMNKTLPLNHFGDSPGDFVNRYWVVDDYYKPGGPVILYDFGEGDAGYFGPFAAQYGSDPMFNVANSTGGLLIIWEHRFYGKSQPPLDSSVFSSPESTAEFYRYHTVEQALEDVVVFAKEFKYDQVSEDLSAGNVPWIFLGTSYPGARAAWLRQRNPEIIYISLASSAPIEIDPTYAQYWNTAKDFMLEKGYSNCTADLAAWTNWMNAIVEDEDFDSFKAYMKKALAELYSSANSDGDDDSSDSSSYYSSYSYSSVTTTELDDIINNSDIEEVKTILLGHADLALYGFQYYGLSQSTFCDVLQEFADDDKAWDEGIFAALGEDKALNIVAEYISNQTSYYETPTLTYDLDTYLDDCLDDSSSLSSESCYYWQETSSISWIWQTCVEFGAFQIANDTDPAGLRPQYENYDFWIQKYCVDQFGATVKDGPNKAPEKKYGGFAGVNPSNTFFPDGEWDPWRELALNGPDSKRSATDKIPEAGETPADKKFFGYIIPELFHGADSEFTGVLSDDGLIDVEEVTEQYMDSLSCDEYRSSYYASYLEYTCPSRDSVEGSLQAQNLFLEAVQKWLPAFEKHDVSNSGGNDDGFTDAGVKSGSSDDEDSDNKKSAATMVPASFLRALSLSFVVSFVFYML